MFPPKRGEWQKENKENLKQGNGNYVNSDTRGGQRKICDTIVQFTLVDLCSVSIADRLIVLWCLIVEHR